MLVVVCPPALQAYVLPPEPVRVVEYPLQIVNDGAAEIVGVGIGFTVTDTVEVLEHPREVPVTV